MSHRDLPERTRRLERAAPTIGWALAERERHRGAEFHLNQAFVDAVGPTTAEAFLSVLLDVGARLHDADVEAPRGVSAGGSAL